MALIWPGTHSFCPLLSCLLTAQLRLGERGEEREREEEEKMSTGCGCVRSPLETAEHRLTGGHEHHCEYLRDRGEGEGKQKEKEDEKGRERESRSPLGPTNTVTDDQIVEPVRTLLEEGTGMTRAVQGKHCPEAVHPEEQELKKPRRKDTPVLSTPPLIPGLRLVKGEKRMIHMEDDEKDGKN